MPPLSIAGADEGASVAADPVVVNAAAVGEVDADVRMDVLPSASALDTDEWDALVADEDFFHCRGWLASLDDALGPAEVLVASGRGGLLGGCALWDGEQTSGLFHLPDFFRDVPGPWGDAFLWGGARRSTHTELPTVPGRRRHAVLRRVLAAARRIAIEKDRACVVIAYMPLRRALEAADADEHACVLLHSAEAVQPAPAGGLQAMLASWRTHDRVRSKAELAAFGRCGNRAVFTPVTPAVAESAARLIADTRAKHHSVQGEEWMRRIFDSQRRSGVLDAAVAIAAVRADGRSSAVCVSYRFGRALHVRYFGSDYSFLDNDFRYFVLCYYLPVDYAAGRGLTQCRLATSALDAKARRGASIEPLAALVLLTDRTPIDAEAVDRHNRRFAAYVHQQFPSRVSGEWSLVAG